YALRGDEKFLNIAKLMHNGLQGAEVEINDSDVLLYMQYNRDIATAFAGNKYDVVFVHNHHLLAMPRYYSKDDTHWVWRCHLDTSNPNDSVWRILKPLVEECDGVIFTTNEFIPSDLKSPSIKVMAPAIDALSLKNRGIPLEQCIDFVESLGIDSNRPILLHASRLDRWKDPLGIINCYYVAKDEVPDLQLVIISSLTLDDPETFSTLHLVDSEASKDTDIHVYSNIDGIGDLEVNVFQRMCRIGIVKSIREGFGLAVSEVLWKGRPVMGSRVGGIPLQLTGELNYCLIDSIEECGLKIARLVNDTDYARGLGELGREHVRKHFLSPRLVRDELLMVKSLMG
ncbi:glycosyltransferase, partial [Chloroflexota bacterium]